jgi:hypothetical protein
MLGDDKCKVSVQSAQICPVCSRFGYNMRRKRNRARLTNYLKTRGVAAFGYPLGGSQARADSRGSHRTSASAPGTLTSGNAPSETVRKLTRATLQR